MDVSTQHNELGHNYEDYENEAWTMITPWSSENELFPKDASQLLSLSLLFILLDDIYFRKLGFISGFRIKY